jgi:hypothetical protein
MVSAACPSPNGPLRDGSMPQHFRGIFPSCMGRIPTLVTSITLIQFGNYKI